MKKFIAVWVLILFASNAYAVSTLVYDGGGAQPRIQTALGMLSISFDLRGPGNPVTAADLASHDLLIVGWNYLGDMSGLSSSVLADGITGNILLAGHDADVHTVEGKDLMGTPGDPVGVAASTFLSQAISFAQLYPGTTGLVVLSDYTTAFSYLPAAWGISATSLDPVSGDGEIVTSFTAQGLASGVYNGLTPNDMSYWLQSYHTKFDSWGTEFTSFELGGANQVEVVTIARIIPAPGAVLLGFLGVGLVGWLRRRKTL